MKPKVIIVSGYFNPLHKGHIEYFHLAKDQGDKLFVIVNNDYQRALKGSKEFMLEEERVLLINELAIVDKVFLSVDRDRSVCSTLEKVYKDNFEVDQSFRLKFLTKNIKNKKFFYTSNNNNKYLFDMRSLIKNQIKENNIKNIDNIDLDTYSNKNLFFSHRRSTHLKELPTGRMINIIGFVN